MKGRVCDRCNDPEAAPVEDLYFSDGDHYVTMCDICFFAFMCDFMGFFVRDEVDGITWASKRSGVVL